MSVNASHVMVLYRPSAEANDELLAARELAREAGARLTVLTVALVERVNNRCCDIRSGYWNEVMRERATDQLGSAVEFLGHEPGVEFAVVSGRSIPSVLAREAAERHADLIVVPRSSFPWSRVRARRLRRKLRGLGGCRVVAGTPPAARSAHTA
jgi:nucleotide-binding universal stress UspA family protein